MGDEIKQKRPRGTGSIYRKSGSRYWWVCYYVNSRPVYESTGSEKITDARNFLKGKIAKAETGNFISPRVQRITVSELYGDLLRDYRMNGQFVPWPERCWNAHLRDYFGGPKFINGVADGGKFSGMRASRVGTEQIAGYVEKRQRQGAAKATINRELALLRRAFSLGFDAEPQKVSRVPKFHRFIVSEKGHERRGFVDEKQYRTLADKAAGQLWLRSMLALSYTYGFRKGELLNMKAGQVDLLARTIRLNRGETKNDEGRVVILTEECYQLVSQMVRSKQADNLLLTRSNGEPVRDFRGAWDKLIKAANTPGLLFHDLRRSAVRNMVRRGVPERVAMEISGHKTRSVFERYNIVDGSTDLAEAALKVERGAKAELARTGIIDSLLTDAPSCSNEEKGGKPEVSVKM